MKTNKKPTKKPNAATSIMAMFAGQGWPLPASVRREAHHMQDAATNACKLCGSTFTELNAPAREATAYRGHPTRGELFSIYAMCAPCADKPGAMDRLQRATDESNAREFARITSGGTHAH